MNGIIVINKEKDMTSRDVVNIISKQLNVKKVGHTGTLDPIATGVLVVCLGSATKLVEILTSSYKEYEAEIILGTQTDSLDITGNIIKEEEVNFKKEEIINALESIKGKYMQEVPIYSAVKVNGMKLYEYARNNMNVTLPKKEVDIKEIELISDIRYENNKIIFKFRCLVSKGTYIRSLIRDIAFKLNTVGIMSNLKRTKQGNFNIENAYTLNDIKNGNFKLIPINECLNNLFTCKVDDYLENKIKNGQLLENRYDSEKILFINQKDEVLAIYEIYEKDSNKIKPWKMF